MERITRRGLIEGAAVAAFAATAATQLPAATPAKADEAPIEPTEVVDCDLCIVGNGFSGLAAAVQAGELGIDTLVVDADSEPGGAARYGLLSVCGLGSELMERLGYHYEIGEIIHGAMPYMQCLPNQLGWVDLLQAAGKNIDWLVGHGAEFDEELGTNDGGKHYLGHLFAGASAGVGYVPAMAGEVEKYGVEVRHNTTASQLLQDESGKVVGLLAQDADGNWVQVNAKAVILATGGSANDPELCARRGYPVDTLHGVYAFANGDGRKMALAAGAKDAIDRASTEAVASFKNTMIFGFPNYPGAIWINQDGERFFAEDCGLDELMQLNSYPQRGQKRSYLVWDAAIIDAYVENSIGNPYAPDISQETFAELVESGDSDLYCADTVEELAQYFDLDPQALVQNVNAYNDLCEQGVDIFGKDPAFLKPIATPPFYIAQPHWLMYSVIGQVATNRKFQVLNDENEPIEGLYAIGLDGCMLYDDFSIMTLADDGASNHIHSARTAVKDAAERYLA